MTTLNNYIKRKIYFMLLKRIYEIENSKDKRRPYGADFSSNQFTLHYPDWEMTNGLESQMEENNPKWS